MQIRELHFYLPMPCVFFLQIMCATFEVTWLPCPYIFKCHSQGKNLLETSVLWPNAIKVMVGKEECMDIEVKESEITCLPPASEPFDGSFENPRVWVRKLANNKFISGFC